MKTLETRNKIYKKSIENKVDNFNSKIKLEENNPFKEYLSNYVYNDASDYPIITNHGETKLENIFNFLLSSKTNPNNKVWSKYIVNSIKHNKNIKKKISEDKTKSIERKKRGRNKELSKYDTNEFVNIKNLKKLFRESTKNYKLNEDNKTLLYKTKIKIYNKKNDKYEYIYEYHYISKIKELNIKLFEYHCNNFHCNEKDLFYIFKENKINFYGLQAIIQDYVKNSMYTKYKNNKSSRARLFYKYRWSKSKIWIWFDLFKWRFAISILNKIYIINYWCI